jgi:hypothetical protein
MPDTLRDVAQLADEGNCILSPRILGLNNPPQPTRGLMIGGEQILDVPQIGGIFLAAPAWLFDAWGYRYPADAACRCGAATTPTSASGSGSRAGRAAT